MNKNFSYWSSSISATTSLKSDNILPKSTSSVYCLIFTDLRNKLLTTLGVTNLKHIVISVAIDEDEDELCGVKSTLPMLLNPLVLCHSIRWGRIIDVSLAVQLNRKFLILTVHLLCLNGILLLLLGDVLLSDSSSTRPIYSTE